MDQDGVVWVKLVQPGVQDSRATRIRYAMGGSFIVDDLCKAAKMEFGPLLAHVAALQLSVSRSATRDNTPASALHAWEVVLELDVGQTGQRPLYIHAPAPPQVEVPEAPTGTKDLADALKRLEAHLTAMEAPHPPQVQDAEPIYWDDFFLASFAWLQSTFLSSTFGNRPSYMTRSSSSTLDTHAAPNGRCSPSFKGFNDTFSPSCPREGEGLRQRKSQHLW